MAADVQPDLLTAGSGSTFRDREAVVVKSLTCMTGRHHWGKLEVSDEGELRMCDRCGRSRYLPVPPTQGPAQTYGSTQPPKG